MGTGLDGMLQGEQGFVVSGCRQAQEFGGQLPDRGHLGGFWRRWGGGGDRSRSGSGMNFSTRRRLG